MTARIDFCFNPLDDDDLLLALSEDDIAEKSGQNLKVFLKTRRLLCYLNYGNGRNRGQKLFRVRRFSRWITPILTRLWIAERSVRVRRRN